MLFIIPFQYDDTQYFSEGLAAVAKNEKFGYIDSSRKLIIPFQYVDALPFYNGLAMVSKNKKTFYIDKKGNIVKDK